LGVIIRKHPNENQNPVATDFKKHIEIQFEKVYLHLDRPYYSAGDDIWIKAYLVDALTINCPITAITSMWNLFHPNPK